MSSQLRLPAERHVYCPPRSTNMPLFRSRAWGNADSFYKHAAPPERPEAARRLFSSSGASCLKPAEAHQTPIAPARRHGGSSRLFRLMTLSPIPGALAFLLLPAKKSCTRFGNKPERLAAFHGRMDLTTRAIRARAPPASISGDSDSCLFRDEQSGPRLDQDNSAALTAMNWLRQSRSTFARVLHYARLAAVFHGWPT